MAYWKMNKIKISLFNYLLYIKFIIFVNFIKFLKVIY